MSALEVNVEILDHLDPSDHQVHWDQLDHLEELDLQDQMDSRDLQVRKPILLFVLCSCELCSHMC